MADHSPLPWRRREAFPSVIVDRQYGKVADCGLAETASDANAAFIVRAVNSHVDMLASLKAFVALYDGTRDMLGASVTAKLATAEAAIAKAEGLPVHV